MLLDDFTLLVAQREEIVHRFVNLRFKLIDSRFGDGLAVVGQPRQRRVEVVVAAGYRNRRLRAAFDILLQRDTLT